MTAPKRQPGPSCLRVRCPGEEDTLSLGRLLGPFLEPGHVVGLTGDLGAGKTVLARGAARGAGVPPDHPVTSPTFTILNVYRGARHPVYHLDLYRIGSEDELEAMGLADLLCGHGPLLVEWIERFPHAFPDDRLDISIGTDSGPGRLVSLAASGSAALRLLRAIRRAIAPRKAR